MIYHPPATTATDSCQRGLAFVKLMRGTGFAAIDVVRETNISTVGEGRHPHGLAVHPTGRWVYLAYASSGTVEVVDTRTLKIIDRTTAVGTAPIGIECSRDGRHVFVTAYGGLPEDEEPGLSILRTNARGNGILEPVEHRPLGTCAGIVTDATGGLWIALKDANELVRLDSSPSFDVTDRIPVPGDPQDVAYEPTYRLLGVNNVADGSVSFVDVRERRVQATVDGPNPRSGAVSPLTDRWFVADTEDDGVTVVDVGDDEPSRVGRISLGTPTAFVDVAPGGEYIVIDAYDDNRVTFVDTRALEVVARVETGETPRHPRFAADGQRCYVPNVDDDSVAVLDTAPLYDGGNTPTVQARIAVPEDSAPSSCFLTERAGRGSYT